MSKNNARTLLIDLNKKRDEEVTIMGWVDVRRDHGKLIFLDLRDTTAKAQVVSLPNHPKAHEIANKTRNEWVLSIKGKVNERPTKMKVDGLNGDIEIEALE